jgi:hypothetical protein
MRVVQKIILSKDAERTVNSCRGTKRGSYRRAIAPASKKPSVLLVTVIFLSAVILNSCGSCANYIGLWRQRRVLRKECREQPRAEVLRRLQPEDAYLLLGDVVFNREHQGPVLIVAVTDKFRKREVVVQRILQGPVRVYQY